MDEFEGGERNEDSVPANEGEDLTMENVLSLIRKLSSEEREKLDKILSGEIDGREEKS